MTGRRYLALSSIILYVVPTRQETWARFKNIKRSKERDYHLEILSVYHQIKSNCQVKSGLYCQNPEIDIYRHML